MADKAKGRQPADQARLKRLPQRFDVWQAGGRQLVPAVRAGDKVVRPWLVAVLSQSEKLILGFELTNEAPTAEQAGELLRRAMRQPMAGEPHRPTEVQIEKGPGWESALRPALEALDIGCVTAESLDAIEAMTADLGQHLATKGGFKGGLLDVPGVTPEAVGSLFDAAAFFYQQAPWKKTGERPIKIECARFDSGPWYAVVMGQAGMARGLALYDDLDTLRRIEQGNLSEEENARLTAGLAVVFGEKGELMPADEEAAERFGWAVAGPEAYPSVYRIEPGLSMWPPLAWELQLLEGCLRAAPEFARKKTRRLAPLAITVPTGSGELPLTLSWAE
jgi:hypothetical protein